jgi:hypothetical protein
MSHQPVISLPETSTGKQKLCGKGHVANSHVKNQNYTGRPYLHSWKEFWTVSPRVLPLTRIPAAAASDQALVVGTHTSTMIGALGRIDRAKSEVSLQAEG